jgi:hypothetical protein
MLANIGEPKIVLQGSLETFKGPKRFLMRLVGILYSDIALSILAIRGTVPSGDGVL